MKPFARSMDKIDYSKPHLNDKKRWDPNPDDMEAVLFKISRMTNQILAQCKGSRNNLSSPNHQIISQSLEPIGPNIDPLEGRRQQAELSPLSTTQSLLQIIRPSLSQSPSPEKSSPNKFSTMPVTLGKPSNRSDFDLNRLSESFDTYGRSSKSRLTSLTKQSHINSSLLALASKPPTAKTANKLCSALKNLTGRPSSFSLLNLYQQPTYLYGTNANKPEHFYQPLQPIKETIRVLSSPTELLVGNKNTDRPITTLSSSAKVLLPPLTSKKRDSVPKPHMGSHIFGKSLKRNHLITSSFVTPSNRTTDSTRYTASLPTRKIDKPLEFFKKLEAASTHTEKSAVQTSPVKKSSSSGSKPIAIVQAHKL